MALRCPFQLFRFYDSMISEMNVWGWLLGSPKARLAHKTPWSPEEEADHSNFYNAEGLSLPSFPLFCLVGTEESWHYPHHLRAAYKHWAVVLAKESLKVGRVVRVGVCREISSLPFLSFPWKVHIYAALVVGSISHYSYLLVAGCCNVAHYFFSLDWNSPVGRNVMRNILSWGH